MKNKLFLGALVCSLTLSLPAFSAGKHSAGHGAGTQTMSSHDPHFLDMMSVHHMDGIKMAQLAAEKAQSPDIKTVAGKVIKDQTKEIEQMKNWRQSHFSSVPKSEDMPPKMDMSKLENASGKEFDRTFAEMMAKHHEDGIKMAQSMVGDLKNKDVKNFAEKSIEKQGKEKDYLEQLQASLEKDTSSGTGTSEE